jgi:hypothetical protein
MCDIKVNDRVVYVDDVELPGYFRPPAIKGREYIVYGKITCKCGTVHFDIGLITTNQNDGDDDYCANCHRITVPNTNSVFVESWRLRKIEEKVNYVKLEVEVEEPCLN